MTLIAKMSAIKRANILLTGIDTNLEKTDLYDFQLPKDFNQYNRVNKDIWDEVIVDGKVYLCMLI